MSEFWINALIVAGSNSFVDVVREAGCSNVAAYMIELSHWNNYLRFLHDEDRLGLYS